MKNLSANCLTINISDKRWYHATSVSVAGYAYADDDKLLEGELLAKYFDVVDETEWLHKLQRCNGLFAIICHNKDFVGVAIDPSRVYPLYYRIDNDKIQVTDNPYSLLRQGDVEDKEAVQAYTVSGATFEGTTLVKDILQIKPGHYLLPNGIQKIFYDYRVSLSELYASSYHEMQSVLNHIFKRLIDRLGGRQVVIPLSGGNDSRLLLCMLKRFGYNNVICYTAGRAGNGESAIAEKVAAQLGYDWYNIDTLQEDLSDLVNPASEDFQQYYTYLGGFCNFVWLYDYIAIIYLQRQGVLNRDAIFIPGHAADFNAGSHLTKACIHKKDSCRYLTSALLYDSFEYQGKSLVKAAIHKYFFGSKSPDIADWSVFQAFVFRNRLPHNILNSARIYQYMGYDVALPFWDKEFLEVFRRLPYELLIHQSYYTDFVRTKIFQPLQVDYPSARHSQGWYLYNKIIKRIKFILPATISRYFVHLQDSLGERELSQPLLDELLAKKVYDSDKDILSVNQIMKDWYLLKVRELLSNSE
ncbi:MAG: asparagine synthase-related protein [Paludibacteraceae bacterium]